MARTSGIIGLECDRCGRRAYERADSPQLSQWHDIERTTVDNAQQKWLFCTACYAAYRTVMSSMDAEFNDFMQAGKNSKEDKA